MSWNHPFISESNAIGRHAHGGHESVKAAFPAGRLAGVVDTASVRISASGRAWSEIFMGLVEGAILSAASLHPGDAFPIEPFRTRRDLRRGDIASPPVLSFVVAHSAGSRTTTARTEHGFRQHRPLEIKVFPADAGRFELDDVSVQGVLRRWARWLGRLMTRRWMSLRRERDIKRAVAAFAEFDDRTLCDMGVPHRSQIEQIVRYCWDC